MDAFIPWVTTEGSGRKRNGLLPRRQDGQNGLDSLLPSSLIDYLPHQGSLLHADGGRFHRLRLEQARYSPCLWGRGWQDPLEKGNDEGSGHEKDSRVGLRGLAIPAWRSSSHRATFALDKKTGETKWKSQVYRDGSPTCFTHGKTNLIAVLKTDGLVILDAANGKTLAFEKWETSYRTNATTPIVQGDKIFISTGYKRGCALFQYKNGKLTKIYENRNLSTHMNNAIPVDDFLYGFDGNAHMAGPKDFVCIRFSTGELKWRQKDGGLMVGSLIVAGDRIIALGQRGEVAIAPVDSEKFSPLTREQVIGGRCWTPPVLAHGMLYLANARGDLVCLDLRK